VYAHDLLGSLTVSASKRVDDLLVGFDLGERAKVFSLETRHEVDQAHDLVDEARHHLHRSVVAGALGELYMESSRRRRDTLEVALHRCLLGQERTKAVDDRVGGSACRLAGERRLNDPAESEDVADIAEAQGFDEVALSPQDDDPAAVDEQPQRFTNRRLGDRIPRRELRLVEYGPRPEDSGQDLLPDDVKELLGERPVVQRIEGYRDLGRLCELGDSSSPRSAG
jgi:hypothetical protein